MQGQTRLCQYYEFLTVRERIQLEGELIRKCLSRNENQCSFIEYRGYKVIYRRYASLYFIIGVDDTDDENENVCELDIMFNLEKAHFILDEMVLNGCIVDTNKANALNPIYLMEKHS